MDTQYLPWLTLALTVVVGAFAWWRTRPLTVASVVDIVSDAAYTARTLVAAAGITGNTRHGLFSTANTFTGYTAA